MPYCPNCHEEYDEGMSACVNCGADLIDSPLFASDDGSLERFESVFVGPLSSAFELKSTLEDEGITVFLQGLDDSQETLDLADEAGLVKILVPIESADAAASVIESVAEFAAKERPADLPFPEEAILPDDLGDEFEGDEDFPAPEGGDPEDEIPAPPSPAERRAPASAPPQAAKKKASAKPPPKEPGKAAPQTPRKGGVKKASRKKAKTAPRKTGRHR